jgi:hypothetical protein
MGSLFLDHQGRELRFTGLLGGQLLAANSFQGGQIVMYHAP